MKLGQFKNRFLNFASFFKEEQNSLSIEGKIFHAFCLISIIGAFVSFFINLFLGVEQLIYISLIIFIVQGLLFYLSKIKGKLNLSIIISSVGLNVLFFINYFYNAGIGGPSLILFAGALFFVISVGKDVTALFWFCANIIIVTFLFTLEYFHEEIVLIKYNTREDLFFDMYFTYLILITVIYIGTIFLRKSYLEQKRSVAEKAIALEKLNAEKDKLFSIISHDLRTPLANVQQYLEMLADVELTQEERYPIEKDLLNITRNAQDLLTNLLEWSRNQMDGFVVKLQHFNLSNEIAKTLTHMQLLASKKEVQLKINIEDNCQVFADIHMLNLVIRNLLHNSIKFTLPGGFVEITAKSNHENTFIAVRDNGTGIPERKKQDIFSLKAVTTFGTNKEKGTGIGLMLCKEYVEMQKGKIWFESEENLGTTFHLSFPNEETIRDQ
jgi:two-component system sensor histidine kinase/response regulator